jgi:hypothetical protein
VEVRTLVDRCENLEAAVRLRAKQDAGKKLLHKLAMAKADVLCTNESEDKTESIGQGRRALAVSTGKAK